MANAEIYSPINYIETTKPEPVIFLAGPIQGTGDWQKKAIELISQQNPNIIIANPRRHYLDGEFDYGKQVDWETFHLKRAGENGSIMFWLPVETQPIQQRAYAQTTRFELAEWKVRHQRDKTNLVIGIEQGFSGERYIRRRFGQDCPEVPILDTLEQTCITAVKMLNKDNS